MPDRRGFTLIELVVVLAVVGVILGITLFRADVQRARLDTSIQNLGLALSAAQQKATMRQHDMVVLFDVASGAIRVHTDQDNDGMVDPDEDVRAIALEDGVRFGRDGADPAPFGLDVVTFTQDRGGLPALTFHRSGSASEYGGFYLASGSGQTEYVRAVEVTRSTGQVRCHSYRTGAWEDAC